MSPVRAICGGGNNSEFCKISGRCGPFVLLSILNALRANRPVFAGVGLGAKYTRYFNSLNANSIVIRRNNGIIRPKQWISSGETAEFYGREQRVPNADRSRGKRSPCGSLFVCMGHPPPRRMSRIPPPAGTGTAAEAFGDRSTSDSGHPVGRVGLPRWAQKSAALIQSSRRRERGALVKQ
jgi:hypothetical protein